MLNEFLLGVQALFIKTNLSYIILAITILAITEYFYINNLLNNRKPKSKQKKDFPYIEEKKSESNIGFVLRSKLAFLFVGTMFSIWGWGIIYLIGMLIYWLNSTTILYILGGAIFFIVNYFIYKTLK